MYSTSTEYKKEIKKPSRSFECKVTIGDRIFYNVDISDIVLDSNIQPSDGFMIGSIASTTLDLTLLNNGETIYSTNQIKLEIGLKIGDMIEYIPMGLYNIDDVKKTDKIIKFIAYDNMTKFESAYFSNLGDTPTLQQVVNELSIKTGVQFTGSLPSYTVKKLEGFTCREILSYVASVCGGNAVITRDGKFTIVYPKDINYYITGDNYVLNNFKREEVKYKIGKVSCQVKEKEIISKGSLGTDSMELLFENPWVSETILTDIYNRLNGFEYLGYNMKWQGDISLDVGDIITCTDVKGVVRKLPILSQKLTYTGGLTSEIVAKGESKNKNSFSSSGSMSNKVNRMVTEVALINKAFIDYAHINDADIVNLKAQTAKIHDLEAETANINTILAGSIGSGIVQTIHLTGKNVTMEDVFIKELIASKMSVGDLLASDISTNKFRIVSDSGKMLIADNTIQIKDANRTRVQIGKDASNDYNMYVWDSSGKLMFDATGLKADGIKSKIIRDDMVSDTANINGSKINISSLVTEVNKDTNTQLIKASKVALDTTGQSLEISFNSLKSNVDSKEGRNLAINTNFNSVWEMYNSARTNIDLAEYGQKITFKQTGQSSMQTLLSVPLIEGEKYTVSMELRGTLKTLELFILTTVSPNLRFYNSTTFLSETEFKKLVYTFTYTGNPSNKLFIGGTASVIGEWLEVKKGTVKLEKGTINTGWIPAPEDIDKKIESNTTSIKAINGQIDTLIKDTTIEENGTTVKLKDIYSSLKQTVNGMSSTVESHSTSITTLGTNVNNANSLADSKAKVFTATPIPPYKVGDIWTSGPSGDIMKCKVARASGAYVASDWEKASKYTDDTKANAVEGSLNTLSGTVTTISNKQATLEQNLNGFKTTVSDTYSTKTELNTAKTDAINSANGSTDTKLKDYSTTTQMKSAITQSADSVKTEVSNTYVNKSYATDTYATKSSVEQTDTQLRLDFSTSGADNIFRNSTFKDGSHWVLNDTTYQNSGIFNTNANDFRIDVANQELHVWGRANGSGKAFARVYQGESEQAYLYRGKTLIFSHSSIVRNNVKITYKVQGWNKDWGGLFDIIADEGSPLNIPDVNNLAILRFSITIEAINSNANTIFEINLKLPKLQIGVVATPWCPNPNEIRDGNTTIDANGVTIYNGAITVKNKSNTEVLKGDSNGNLTLQGKFEQYGSNGVKSVSIINNQVNLYDWSRDGDLVGGLSSTLGGTGGSEPRGSMMVYSDKGNPLLLGYSNLERNSMNSVIIIDDVKVANGGQSMVGIYQDVSMMGYANISLYGSDHTIPLGGIAISSSNNMMLLGRGNYNSVLIGEKGYENPGMLTGFAKVNASGLYVWGGIACSGSKTRLVPTQNYDGVKLNALETAEPLFEDVGEGKIGEDGLCYIFIDPILQETINSKCSYQVFLQKYGEGELFVLERTENYFIVKGTPELKFGWRMTAKQRGYETDRLEREKIEIPEDFEKTEDEEMYSEIEELSYKYLKDYEKELIESVEY